MVRRRLLQLLEFLSVGARTFVVDVLCRCCFGDQIKTLAEPAGYRKSVRENSGNPKAQRDQPSQAAAVNSREIYSKTLSAFRQLAFCKGKGPHIIRTLASRHTQRSLLNFR